MELLSTNQMLPIVTSLIILAIVWDGFWKIIAMWRSARNNHVAWFICIAIFNTLGILPIIYILLHRHKNSLE